jgi:hypothetical protein
MDKNEVILSQSSLKNEYYNDLIPYKDTGYDKINTFDNVNPSYMTTTHTTSYDYNKIVEMEVLKPFSEESQSEPKSEKTSEVKEGGKKNATKKPKKLKKKMKLLD